jgi:hypothetical protein
VVEYLDAYGCTALTSIDAPVVKTLDAHGCTALTSIDAPVVKTLYASGCTALTGGSVWYAGDDSRGYSFAGVGKRVLAGCRNFTLPKARKHWGPGGLSDRPDCLALVEKIAAWAESMKS